MSNLLITILTPSGLIYEGEALECYVPSSKGPLGLLPGHTPVISPLADKGVIRLKSTDGVNHYFAIWRGVLEVRPDKSLLLSESCLSAETLEKAEELLQKEQPLSFKQDQDVVAGEAALTSAYAKAASKPYNKDTNK
jgi:F-type H+-transporting ATPase subunit epsilon